MQQNVGGRLLGLAIALVFLVETAAAMETNRKRDGVPPNQVEMPFLVAPANNGDTLVGYHYMILRIVTPSAADTEAVKKKIAFIQDAFVRSVYKSCISMANDPTKVDLNAVHDRLLAIARQFVSVRIAKDLIIVDLKYGSIHPATSGSVPTPSGPPAAGNNPAPKNGSQAGAGAQSGGHVPQ